MRLYLKKTLHKNGLVEWFRVQALSSNPSITKKSEYRIFKPAEITIRGLR
jgi:hypothetical protein